MLSNKVSIFVLNALYLFFVFQGDLCDGMADQHQDFSMTEDHLVSQARWNPSGESYGVGNRNVLSHKLEARIKKIWREIISGNKLESMNELRI